MIPRTLKIFLLFICFVFFSCNSEENEISFDYSKFKVDNKCTQLCFDLTSDTKVQGAIGLKISDNSKKRMTIILPFETSNISKNRKVFNANLSDNYFTIIDYLATTDKEWIFFRPKFEQLEKNNRGVFWIKEGLIRKFIIKFEEPHPNKELVELSDSIPQIGILLPEKSKTFRTKIIPTYEGNDYYQFETSSIQKMPEKAFRIEYMVEATKKQKEVLDFLLKLAAILFVPFIQFIFIEKEPTDPKKIKIKKYSIIGSLIAQIIIFLLLSYFGYCQYRESGEFPTFEMILLIVGLLIEALVLWMKNGK